MTSTLLVLWILFLAHFFAVNVIYLTMLAAGAVGNRQRMRSVRNRGIERESRSALTIPVSVVIPAHDEEDSILNVVRSALRSDFPELEVIVVDDGSTDNTLDRLRRAFDLEVVDRFYPQPLTTRPVRRIHRSRIDSRLTVAEKEGGGKADACNAGVNLARYRYVFLTDADCVFHPEAILRTMQPVNFDPRRIVGIGGNLRVLNGLDLRDGVVRPGGLPPEAPARFQILEYATAFVTHRVGWSALNAVHVLSGGFSAWRRDVLVELGGFTTRTTHEDIEITFRMHRHFRDANLDYRLISISDPVIWTEVPRSWGGLYLQRKRWQRVLYETLWIYRGMAFNPRYGKVGTLAMPYLLLFEAFGPFIEVAAYIFTVILFVAGVLSVEFLFVFLAFSFGQNAIVRIGSLLVDLRYLGSLDRPGGPMRVLHLGGLALVEYIVFRPVVLSARVVAFFEFLGRKRTWERVERRKGSDQAGAPGRAA